MIDRPEIKQYPQNRKKENKTKEFQYDDAMALKMDLQLKRYKVLKVARARWQIYMD
jgi:hypothetical protein